MSSAYHNSSLHKWNTTKIQLSIQIYTIESVLKVVTKKRKETATLLLLRIYLNPRYAISF